MSDQKDLIKPFEIKIPMEQKSYSAKNPDPEKNKKTLELMKQLYGATKK